MKSKFGSVSFITQGDKYGIRHSNGSCFMFEDLKKDDDWHPWDFYKMMQLRKESMEHTVQSKNTSGSFVSKIGKTWSEITKDLNGEYVIHISLCNTFLHFIFAFCISINILYILYQFTIRNTSKYFKNLYRFIKCEQTFTTQIRTYLNLNLLMSYIYRRKRGMAYDSEKVQAKFRKVKSTYTAKRNHRKGTGGGPPVHYSGFEAIYDSMFGGTVSATGIQGEGIGEVGCGGKYINL